MKHILLEFMHKRLSNLEKREQRLRKHHATFTPCHNEMDELFLHEVGSWWIEVIWDEMLVICSTILDMDPDDVEVLTKFGVLQDKLLLYGHQTK